MTNRLLRAQKKVIYFLISALLAIALLSGIFFLYLIRNLPDVGAFDNRKVAQSSKIYDRTGAVLLYEIHGEEKRTIIPFSDIPDLVKQATIAIEDASFYKHSALDFKSVIRALLTNIKKGKISQGGSTITQQLAKKAFLSDERTFIRKFKEIILAFKLESKYSKDEILNLYLNQIPYGFNSYGIAAASQTYFGKLVKDLKLVEIVVLVSLPQAPSYYSPSGSHKDDLIARKDLVLEKMLSQKYISEDQYNQVKNDKLDFLPQTTEIKAPHFVFTVIDYLNSQYGEDFVRTAGLKVITTLDWDIQQLAEKAVYDGAKRNESLYEGKNAALVAQDAKTGQILAIVGSRDYFDTDIDGNFNVATQGLRQPGSAIKPFAYVTAFKKGYTPDTILLDLETEFDSTGDPEKSYKPGNFDETFRGPVTMKEALSQSINIPAVKTLYLAGMDNMLKTVHNFGITTLGERSRYGLSLVLGGGEVKLIDLVGAYSVFSQDGIKHKQTLILQVTDSTGKNLEFYSDSSQQVIDAQYPRMINNILSDKDLRRPLFQNSFNLTTFDNYEVALKTGTTNDYRDAWTLGYTPSFVVGVWAGNNDNSPMVKHGSSILAAVPIWSSFMSEALKKIPPGTFTKPDPVNADKPILRGEINPTGELHDILYYINKDDPQGEPPFDPTTDNQFKNWEDPIAKWISEHPLYSTSSQNSSLIISEATPLIIQINSPQTGTFINEPISINVKIKALNGVQKTDLYFNNVLVEQNYSYNITKQDKDYYFNAEFTPKNKEFQNLLKIKVIDYHGFIAEKEVILYK